MNASHILLNHFSQRYPKLPKLNLPTHPSIDGERQSDISISFDFMSIKVGDMWKMAHYMDPLSLLFDEAEPDDGDETTGAVEGDLNPTLDAPAKAKGLQNGKGAQNQPGGDAPISKKASKRAERKAAQKLLDEEKEGNNAVRQRSPGDTPEAKRTRMDVEAVSVTNTA
jgi:ribonuclease Z